MPGSVPKMRRRNRSELRASPYPEEKFIDGTLTASTVTLCGVKQCLHRSQQLARTVLRLLYTNIAGNGLLFPGTRKKLATGVLLGMANLTRCTAFGRCRVVLLQVWPDKVRVRLVRLLFPRRGQVVTPHNAVVRS